MNVDKVRLGTLEHVQNHSKSHVQNSGIRKKHVQNSFYVHVQNSGKFKSYFFQSVQKSITIKNVYKIPFHNTFHVQKSRSWHVQKSRSNFLMENVQNYWPPFASLAAA